MAQRAAGAQRGPIFAAAVVSGAAGRPRPGKSIFRGAGLIFPVRSSPPALLHSGTKEPRAGCPIRRLACRRSSPPPLPPIIRLILYSGERRAVRIPSRRCVGSDSNYWSREYFLIAGNLVFSSVENSLSHKCSAR